MRFKAYLDLLLFPMTTFSTRFLAPAVLLTSSAFGLVACSDGTSARSGDSPGVPAPAALGPRAREASQTSQLAKASGPAKSPMNAEMEKRPKLTGGGAAQVGNMANPQAGVPSPAPGPKRVVIQQILVKAGDGTSGSKDAAFKLANNVYKMAGSAAPSAIADARKLAGDANSGMVAICLGKDRVNPSDKLRSEIATAIGDSAFAMKVGDIRIVQHDPAKNPDGHYIIKRVE